MKNGLYILIILLSNVVNAAASSEEQHKGAFYNTYNGVPITMQNIVDLAPKMPEQINKATDALLEKHPCFFNQLTQSGRKMAQNDELIAECSFGQRLGKGHYVVKFK